MTRHAHWWEDQGARLVCAQCRTGIPLIEFNDIPPSAPPGIMPTTQSLRVLAEIVTLWAERRQNTQTDMPRPSSQLIEAVCAFEGYSRVAYFKERWTMERYVEQLPTQRLVKLLEFLMHP